MDDHLIASTPINETPLVRAGPRTPVTIILHISPAGPVPDVLRKPESEEPTADGSGGGGGGGGGGGEDATRRPSKRARTPTAPYTPSDN
jgi:hypothetical protein|tara:strand:- start:308 stop:574 length:267 start_codon:yes stop_codon:yes gene_type:complete